VSGDLDTLEDLYQRRDGRTRLVSADARGRSLPCRVVDPGLNSYDCVPIGVVQSPSGSHVTFSTNEPLVTGDSNGLNDIYDRHDGTTGWITSGPGNDQGAAWGPAWITDDGSRAVFETSQNLDPRDTDESSDVYERVNGTTRLLSTGPAAPGGENVMIEFRSTDLRHVFFQSWEPMVPEDADSSLDEYETFGGVTSLVSTGPADGNTGELAMAFRGTITPDGSHAYFVTKEALTADDTDTDTDAYMRAGGQTTLLTPG
jgi:hypothetical protein